MERLPEPVAHPAHARDGTGKTFIAFQIAWKLFKAVGILAGTVAPPRILFLAYRNTLADQAYNAFSAFRKTLGADQPDDIRKKGKVPKNGSLFFTIFQTFMSGPPRTTIRRPTSVNTRRTSSTSS